MDVFGKLIVVVLTILGVIVVSVAFSLLMAFPVMWCWNFAVVAAFGLPKITWGMAWCLTFLASIFLKSSVSVNKS